MTDRITVGAPEPLGVTPDAAGSVNVAVYSAHARAIEFCLFDAQGNTEVERFRLGERSGDVFHAHITGIPLGSRYGLRAHGPYDPSQGHRFNAAKLLVDPYALQLDRPFVLDASMLGFRRGAPRDTNAVPDERDDRDSAAAVPKALVLDRAALVRPSRAVRCAWSDSVIYELHVRGFTRQHPEIAESIRGTFAALAEPAAIAHLVDLGVTTVEWMPSAAWIDERHLQPLGLHNYWGYNPIAMMAPDPRLAPGGWADVRRATDALHAAGIEVVLDVVFNHSGESDELGPTLSFRGLDNASYYRLLPGRPDRYINDTGCGNCLALDRPVNVQLMLASLRTWIELGGVDGFRFDLATALGRRESGFDAAAPLLEAIDRDPLLARVKLIAEPWDIGPGGYQTGKFPAHFGEWNDRFRDDVRRFWRGDANLRGALATRLAGSADVFAAKQHASRGINFVTAHDGFTLADLVSYSLKHNQANGEDNRDGTDANYSWNHGAEGASDDENIIALRQRDQRNLLATLLLARGTPMLAMGAELGATQGGNNNAYAQDNATSWLDWSQADRHLMDFTRRLIALRGDHAALRDDRFVDGAALDGTGIVDVEWRAATQHLKTSFDWEQTGDETLVAVWYSPGADLHGDRVAVAVHRGSRDVQIVLPAPRAGWIWQRSLDTACVALIAHPIDAEGVSVCARSVVVFVEQVGTNPKQAMRDVESAALGRLADAAGIAREWWDIGGSRHAVGADTQRHLLAAMRLPASTTAEVRDSLQRIAMLRERRLLPASQVVRAKVPNTLRVAVAGHQASPRGRLDIRDADERIVAQIDANDLAMQVMRDSTGARLRIGELALPDLPAGRYRAGFDSAPQMSCVLTVAPPRCHRPEPFSRDAADRTSRPFGLSVQAYSLRRTNDDGIGDFSAIGEFAAQAARAGAATIGINPLHMLFPHDRSRASPYHPSDRRFLDPIYLDIAALSDIPGFADLSWPRLDPVPLRDTIDYAQAWRRKSESLQELYAAMQRTVAMRADHPARASFDAFVEAGGDLLHRFAIFQAIAESDPDRAWPQWPLALRDAHNAAVDAFGDQHADAVRYHQFLQWLCDRQLGAAAAQGRKAGLSWGLYRDLAVGAAPDGAEAWANAAFLASDVSIGAPPDPLAPEGQVWNLPPPDPLAWLAQDCAPFRAAVAANMRHAGMLRIDHVLGLARLFWVPRGGKSADGAYVAYPVDDLLGHLAMESQRRQCAVVGEDLGTVPDGLREKLAQNGMLRYQVLLLERDGAAFTPPRGYSPQAVACACTHDLPPLAGWWQAADIDEREALGLLMQDTATTQRRQRRDEKRLLLEALGRDGVALDVDLDQPIDAATMAAIHAWLAQAPSALLLAQAEDLAFDTVGQNLPGTDRERPNWQRRLAMPSSDLFASQAAQRIIRALRE